MIMLSEYPDYTVRERIADGIIHAVGVSGSVVATIIVLSIAMPGLPAHSAVSLIIYSVAMIAMFCFSAAYHLIPHAHWKGGLKRLDQAAIFLKIAGTYTPFAVVSLGGLWGYGLLGAVWFVALFGALTKLFLRNDLGGFTIALYLALGWAGIAVIQPLAASVSPGTLMLIGAGGVLYTIGVIFHLWHSLPYQNAIWHLFVLVAASCHFAAVIDTVVLV
ncbi:MAG TPA: hemolysin III family protein [Afifellaceae bacterium]|nr:hemolysin III family protein [Afifellaceae bacterium]